MTAPACRCWANDPKRPCPHTPATDQTAPSLADLVRAFLDERAGFLTAMEACRHNQSDYDRWAGHAQARRIFAEQLKAAGIDLEAKP